MPVNPSHIAQIAVPVRDLDRAKGFYGETLGLTHLFDAPPGLCLLPVRRDPADAEPARGRRRAPAARSSIMRSRRGRGPGARSPPRA